MQFLSSEKGLKVRKIIPMCSYQIDFNCAAMNVKPQGGGRATHRVLTVRSVPRVVILIIQDIFRVENLT